MSTDSTTMNRSERDQYLHELIGKQGYMAHDGVHYPVKILDSRWVYGRFDVEITPLFGKGRRWTMLDTIELGKVM